MEEQDFAAEIEHNPEPDSAADQYRMRWLYLPNDQWPVETVMEDWFTIDDPYREVEAARESQAYTLEERLEPFGLYWEMGL